MNSKRQDSDLWFLLCDRWALRVNLGFLGWAFFTIVLFHLSLNRTKTEGGVLLLLSTPVGLSSKTDSLSICFQKSEGLLSGRCPLWRRNSGIYKSCGSRDRDEISLALLIIDPILLKFTFFFPVVVLNLQVLSSFSFISSLQINSSQILQPQLKVQAFHQKKMMWINNK